MMNKLKLIFMLTLLLSGPLVHAAEITVAADRNPVSLDESFQLVFSAAEDVDGEPDFSPLENDFEILGKQESSHISIINGNRQSEKRWIVSLLAKHSGDIIIPAITFGKDRSQPGVITVKQSGDDRDKGREIFVEVETSDDSVYVQQQLGVTARVFRSIAVANATLSPLTVSGVNTFVENISADNRYRTRIDDKLYDVFERRYALYPQASGELTINQVIFKATRGMGRFFADPFGERPKSIIRRSEEKTLMIKAVPPAFQGNYWLPVKSLQLDESWSAEPPVFHVGEPLTLTIKQTARGLPASQLPEISLDLPDQIKAYPDQPVLNNQSMDQDLLGSREDKIALIPSEPGQFVLPEIRIPYWSVDTDSNAVAVIPERRIEVLPAATAPGAVPPAEAANVSKPAPVTGATETAAAGDEAPASSLWQWLSAVLLVLWLLTLYMWRRSAARPDRVPLAHTEPGAGPALKAVEQACRENDPQQCKQALLNWARHNWSERPPRSLGEISRRFDHAISDHFDALNNALYSNTGGSWKGDEFWLAFRRCAKNNKRIETSNTGTLEPMFRIG